MGAACVLGWGVAEETDLESHLSISVEQAVVTPTQREHREKGENRAVVSDVQNLGT